MARPLSTWAGFLFAGMFVTVICTDARGGPATSYPPATTIGARSRHNQLAPCRPDGWGRARTVAGGGYETRRSKLIGVSLSEKGIDVGHIDENGELKKQENIMLRLTFGSIVFFGYHKPGAHKKSWRQVGRR